MALWKPFRGNRADLDTVPKHDGYIYFCTDDGSLFFDYIDADGVLQRKQINAKEAEELVGFDPNEVPKALSELTDDATHRVVTDAEKSVWNAKVDASDISTAVTVHNTNSSAHADIRQAISQLSSEKVGVSTPQMYGAKGDGITDDTRALKNALAVHDEVFLPKGEYLITEPIDLTNGKSLYSYNQEGTIVYKGAGSVFYLGRRTRINGIKVKVDSVSVTEIFNTDNRIFPSALGNLMTEIDDIEVYFNWTINDTEIGDYNTTLIKLIASNKDYLGCSGYHNQSYSNIRVAGQQRIKYGIKICVSFDDAYVEDATGILPWITNMRFNHIWLGSPETAIKIYRENNSGTGIDYSTIVKTEHIMFTDVATQCSTDEHCKIFYDVAWCKAEFINCHPWDYHHVLRRGEKYNIVGEGAWLSVVGAQRSPITDTYFPSVTDTTPEEAPSYFLKKFFNFVSTDENGGYDFIDSKLEGVCKLSTEEIGGIAEAAALNIITSSCTNIMLDSRTKVKVLQRWSSSSQEWVNHNAIDTLIIPVPTGMLSIRFSGNDLSANYQGVYLSNDLVSYNIVGEHSSGSSPLFVTTEGGDSYLRIDNMAGYIYCTIPFKHTTTTMNADNMIVTINEAIRDGIMNGINNHLIDGSVHVTPEEKEAWNDKSDFSGSYNDLTDKPTIPTIPVHSVNGKTGVVSLSASDVGALASSSHTTKALTVTYEDGTTETVTLVVTK